MTQKLFSTFFRFAVLFCCLLSACDKPEQIPAYLHIDDYQVAGEGGAAWHKITDAWVYVNGELLGAFPLPANIPVLAEGDAEVVVFAGVRENGIAETPAVYPMMQKFTKHYTLTPKETTTVVPVFNYDPAVTFSWEPEATTFDGNSSLSIENRDGDPDNSFEITNNGGFSGRCVLMKVDTAHSTMEIATGKVPLPTSGGQEVWLELHHRNDVQLTLFLLGSSDNDPETAQVIYGFNATENDGWNKIYINLTQFVVDLRKTDYRLYFRATLPLNDKGAYDQLSGAARIDNIRLVHF
jgi:hypothetical protein